MTIAFEKNPATGQTVKWANPQDITWSLATRNLPGQLAQFSSFMPTNPYAEIVNQAFTAWEGADPALHFIYSPDSPSVDIRVGFESLNVPAHIGDTRFLALGATITKAVIGIEDPHLDPLSMPIAASSTWKGSVAQLLQVLEHEIGHAIGLDHDTADNHSIMYPTAGTTNRILSANDAIGVRNLYPLPAPPPPSMSGTPQIVDVADRTVVAHDWG
jgi:predicted Zn-dependent protease